LLCFRNAPVLRRQTDERRHAATNREGLETAIVKPVRHTDARRLARSCAGEKDRGIPWQRGEQCGDLIGRNAGRSVERGLAIILAPYVDDERARVDEGSCRVEVDPERRPA
jgi:hypothetical protein